MIKSRINLRDFFVYKNSFYGYNLYIKRKEGLIWRFLQRSFAAN